MILALQVVLAFQEAGADVTRYIIYLQNKLVVRIENKPVGKVGHLPLQVAFIGI